MQEIGGAQPGDRTIIDALDPVLKVISAMDGSFDDLNALAKAAKDGAESTKTMEPRAGRSAYLHKADCDGHMDPGCYLAMIVFDAIAKCALNEKTFGKQLSDVGL